MNPSRVYGEDGKAHCLDVVAPGPSLSDEEGANVSSAHMCFLSMASE